MSERLNLSGFRLARMRSLLKSSDHDAVARIRAALIDSDPLRRPDEVQSIMEIVSRAIDSGVPFPELGEESYLHAIAAGLLASDGQESLATPASVYGADALREVLWPRYGKFAGPEARAFLRGLVEGVPLFGSRCPSDGPQYAAISKEKLDSFAPGLRDFREQVIYRARPTKSKDGDPETAEFVVEFCECIETIRDGGRDLWYVTG